MKIYKVIWMIGVLLACLRIATALGKAGEWGLAAAMIPIWFFASMDIIRWGDK